MVKSVTVTTAFCPAVAFSVHSRRPNCFCAHFLGRILSLPLKESGGLWLSCCYCLFPMPAQQSICDILPNELTIQIMSLCARGSQVDMCLVSKHFKDLAEQLLYQNIISFDKALSAISLQYGSWVKDLSICPNRGDSTRLEINAINRILQTTTELHQLTLKWCEEMPDLEKLRFPQLRILHLAGYPKNDDENVIVASFVNLHPDISHLVAFWRDLTPSASDALINLPNLITYRGLSPNVVGKTPKLRSARFTIAERDVTYLARLPRTCQDIVIESQLRWHITPLFTLLNQYLPKIKSFMLIDRSFPGVVHLSTISDLLSIFNHLESFAVVVPHPADYSADDEEIVQSWADRCPTLQECALLQSLRQSTGRYKVVDGKVQPTTESCRMEMLPSMV
ncbi:hypothetical protein C8J56DRAFT_977233 [Mycena floridula]|nr:hypothetical protein C8J56DRAFT_977233 [Mycena floridula]